MNYFVYVDGILGVKTNGEDFAWSYGTVAPKTSKEKYEECKIKILLEVRNSDEVFDKNMDISQLSKYHYFYAKQGERKIYYERNFLGKRKLRYSIQINKNDIHVIVGKNYMKYIKHRIMGLHSMSYILTDIVAGLFLEKGIATIHCSAVSKNGKTIIIFAPPDTGKTLTSMRLCIEHGYNFIAEDFALTDGKNVWSVPWTSTFRFYDELNESKIDDLINKVKSNMPILSLLPIGSKKKSVDNYLGSYNIARFSKATDVVLLERGAHSKNYDKKEGLRKIINLNRYEFNYHKAPVLIAMNYFNPDISPERMFENEKQILSELIGECNYLCISEKNPQNYSDAIKNEIESM